MKQKQEQRLYEKATGKISVRLINDMMLHYAMQESKVALKGLICAAPMTASDMEKTILS